jgi:FAD/FMN-containing dehydrogenase
MAPSRCNVPELAAIVGAEHVEAPPPAAYLYDATITRGLRAWGHAGDGNIHATFLIAPDEAAAAERAMALKLGGAVTGEHGIGWLKRGHVPASHGLHAAVKTAFDPRRLLNPDKKS